MYVHRPPGAVKERRLPLLGQLTHYPAGRLQSHLSDSSSALASSRAAPLLPPPRLRPRPDRGWLGLEGDRDVHARFRALRPGPATSHAGVGRGPPPGPPPSPPERPLCFWLFRVSCGQHFLLDSFGRGARRASAAASGRRPSGPHGSADGPRSPTTAKTIPRP